MIGNGMFNPLLQTLTLLEFLGSEDISSEIKQKIVKSAACKYAESTLVSVRDMAVNQSQCAGVNFNISIKESK